MAEESLQSANFEKIDIDSNGKYVFTNALERLRRYIIGIHNKIFPVFVMNDASNPVNVTLNNPQGNTIAYSNTGTGSGTTTLLTVPVGKTFYITHCGVSGIFAATASGITLTADGDLATDIPLVNIQGIGVTVQDHAEMNFASPFRVTSGRLIKVTITTGMTAGKWWVCGFTV